MKISPHLFNTNRPPTSGGFRGPGTSMMPELGSNQLIQTRLLETVTFLSHAGQRAHRLNDALAAIPSAFGPRAAASSNPNALQIVSFSGQQLANTAITIQQVATTQRNEGLSLNSSVKMPAEGLHKFEIEVHGKSHEISFEVEGEITNRQFQQMMADAINEASLGIKATVNTSGNNSRLILETGTTGPGMDDGPRFIIRDIEGEAVKLAGVGEITQEAQSAIFSVNGGENQVQATNRVDLGNGLIVNLVAPSQEPVNVFLGQDRFAMRNSVHNVVNQFNSMLEVAHVNSVDRNTRMLIRDLNSAVRSSRRELERIGISIGRDGTLSVNENVLSEAMDNGSLSRFFAGGEGRQPSGFISRLGRISESVVRNPMRHVSPHARNLPGFNNAMNAVANDMDSRNAQTPTPFDAYSNDDLLSFLFDALR